MKPLSQNLDKYRKDGCMPVSASCVIWNGPDIPCINLCKGDTIEDVVYQLATILCDITENVLDVTTLDFECLLVNGQCPPETLLETLQLLISNACTPPTPPDPPGPDPLPNVNLPECLWYVDGAGDTITALPLDEYVEYLASQICHIIADVFSINAVIASLNTRVTILEAAIGGGGGGGGGAITNIITQCLSGSVPGLTLPIATAFFNLEQKLCEYLELLGTLTEWQAMFNNICIDNTTILPCGTGTYGDIAGWIDNPISVAGSMNNLWLIVCKINDCISGTSVLPCVLVPPVSATLSNLTTTGCRVNWVAPTTPTSEAPLAYKIEVYTLIGITPLVTTTVGPTPSYYTIVSPSIVAGTEYIVKVYAVYDCGTSSSVQVQGILSDIPYVAKLFYNNGIDASTLETCSNPVSGIVTPFTETNREITISLKDSVGVPVINSGGPIETTIRISQDGCPGDPNTITDLLITIPTGSTFGVITYISSTRVYCPGAPTTGCITLNTNVDCWGGSELSGGGPLPATIGIDVSLSSLGTC